MKYRNEITLLNVTRSTDSIGNIIEQISKQTTVLCEMHSVGSKEYYNAVSVGLRPVAEVQIRLTEWPGANKAYLEGQYLDILRTIYKGPHDYVLVLGYKLENNDEAYADNG